MRRKGLFSKKLAALLLSASMMILPITGSRLFELPVCAMEQDGVSYSFNDEAIVFIMAQAREQLAAQEGATAASKVVELKFDRNVNLSLSDIRTLCSDIPAKKKCLFTYNGERYVMEIPMIDTQSPEYVNALEIMAKEPGKRATFIRVAQIFKNAGVTVSAAE